MDVTMVWYELHFRKCVYIEKKLEIHIELSDSMDGTILVCNV